jgi:hypothetical protein
MARLSMTPSLRWARKLKANLVPTR